MTRTIPKNIGGMWPKPISNYASTNGLTELVNPRVQLDSGNPSNAVRSLFHHRLSLVFFADWSHFFPAGAWQFFLRSLWHKRKKPFLSQHPYIKSQRNLLGTAWSYVFTDHRGQADQVASLARPGPGSTLWTVGWCEWLALWELHGTDQFSHRKESWWTDKNIRCALQLHVFVTHTKKDFF